MHCGCVRAGSPGRPGPRPNCWEPEPRPRERPPGRRRRVHGSRGARVKCVMATAVLGFAQTEVGGHSTQRFRGIRKAGAALELRVDGWGHAAGCSAPPGRRFAGCAARAARGISKAKGGAQKGRSRGQISRTSAPPAGAASGAARAAQGKKLISMLRWNAAGGRRRHSARGCPKCTPRGVGCLEQTRRRSPARTGWPGGCDKGAGAGAGASAWGANADSACVAPLRGAGAAGRQ